VHEQRLEQRAEPRRQRAPGSDQVARPGRREVLRQQRDVVAGRQHLAVQGGAQHHRVDRRDQVGRRRHGDGGGLRDGDRGDLDG
jgi:hypothetical protein